MGINITNKEVFFIIPNAGNEKLSSRMSKFQGGKPYDFNEVAKKLVEKFGVQNIYRYNYCEVEQTEPNDFSIFENKDFKPDKELKNHPRFSKDNSICETPRDATNRVLNEIFKQKGKPRIFKKGIFIGDSFKDIYVSYNPENKKACKVVSEWDDKKQKDTFERINYQDKFGYFHGKENFGDNIANAEITNIIKEDIQKTSYYQVKTLLKNIFDFIKNIARRKNFKGSNLYLNSEGGLNIILEELIRKLNIHLQNIYHTKKDYRKQLRNICDFIYYIYNYTYEYVFSIWTGEEFETQYLQMDENQKKFMDNFYKSDLTNILLYSWDGQPYDIEAVGENFYTYFLINLDNDKLSSYIKNCIQFLDGYFNIDLSITNPSLYKFKNELLSRL